MFPDFPEYKSRIQKLLLRRVQHAIKEIAPVLGEIHTFRQHEGNSGVLARSDGSTDVMDFPEITSELKLSHEEMKSLSLEQVAERLQSVARDFASAQMKLMVKKVSEAADTVGNTVSAGGGDFTPELFFEMIRKIHIDFDPETGAPQFPTFLVHPSQGDKLRNKLEQWSSNPELHTEYTKILQTKFEEWRAREDLRKLVD
jgi:hypothetical protein